jgi:hypothetical protein
MEKTRRLKPAATSFATILLVPKLLLGNAVGAEAPASLNLGADVFGEKAGAFSSTWVPKQSLGTRKNADKAMPVSPRFFKSPFIKGGFRGIFKGLFIWSAQFMLPGSLMVRKRHPTKNLSF